MRHMLSLLLISLFSFACQPQTIVRDAEAPAFSSPPRSGPAPWTHLNFAREGGEFRFAVMSDRNGGERPGIFEKGVEKLNLLQPEFVMCVGDLIPGYANTMDAMGPQYDQMDRILSKLQSPFFRVVGNHDITAPNGMQGYLSRYGQSYYHFVYGNVLFLVLCTEEAGNFSPRQFEYVRTALEQNRNVRWTFVFMHKPLFKNKGDAAWNKVEEMLKPRPFTVFAGHDHVYCRHVVNGREHLILSTTGGGNPLRGIAHGEFDHTVWVTMTDKGPRIANLLLDGVYDTSIRTDKDADVARLVRLDVDPLLVDWPQFRAATTNVTISNNTDEAVKVEAAFESNPVLVPAQRAFSLIVPAHSVRAAPVKIDALWQCPVEYLSPLRAQARIFLATGDPARAAVTRDFRILPTRTQACPEVRGPITVDGKLDDWAGVSFHVARPAQVQGNAAKHGGLADGRFRIATAHDKEWVYVVVDVEDDKLFLPSDRPIWEQDGLEVRLCALPEPGLGRYHADNVDHSDVLVMMVAPGKSGDKPYIYDYQPRPTGTKIACVRTVKGYVAEFAIPASYLDKRQGRAWQAFRLNVAMNDFDSPKEKGAQLWWAPDWRTGETYSGSGTFLRK